MHLPDPPPQPLRPLRLLARAHAARGAEVHLQGPDARAPAAARAPQCKGSGMKLGSKKTTQSQLLDALGGEALLSEDMSVPTTPAATTPEPHIVAKNERSSLPEVIQERCVHCLMPYISCC